MIQPTTRALAVLELLQTRGRMSGKDIAERLEIAPRAVRRYITMLRDLGIPITAERGNTGAYVLGAGGKLPPMMFTNDESLALTLGLLASRQVGMNLSNTSQAVESALAKLERVMPFELRGQVRALSEAVTLDLSTRSSRWARPGVTPANVLMPLSDAVRRRVRTHMAYVAANNERTEREFDPYGVALRQSNWYAVGYCHLRHSLRSFRLDRVESVALTQHTFEPPAGFDALDYLDESLKSLPLKYTVEVIIGAELDEVREYLFEGDYFLEPHERGTRLHGRTDTLKYLVKTLAQFDCPIWPVQPAELSTLLVAHAQRLAANVTQYTEQGPAHQAGDVSE
jgi:predicted DNA-binding transcriptional regulator YafY